MVDQSANSSTSLSLLVRLQQTPADHAAWAEFVARYGLRIQSWCRRWGMQESDAQDLSQIVLVKLLQAMQTFRYDPNQKFRGWLKTVAHHVWQDLVRGHRQVALGGNNANDLFQSLAARDDLAARVEEAYEQELLEQALERVRLRVQQQTWEAFRLTAFDGLPGAEVATRLGIPVISVYKAKSNVQKLLQGEVRILEGGEL